MLRFAANGLLAIAIGFSLEAQADRTQLDGDIRWIDELRIVTVGGRPYDAGRAHGSLLAEEIVATVEDQVGAWFRGNLPRYEALRRELRQSIALPVDMRAEIAGIVAGMRERGVDAAHSALLRRRIDELDLWFLNSLDVLARFGCSGAVVWGDRSVAGRVWAGRNFDWSVASPGQLERSFVLVRARASRSFATVTWPGYLGAVSGVSEAGVAVSVHVANGIGARRDGPAVPLAALTREVLADAEPEAAFAVTERALARANPRHSFLICVVRPASTGDEPCAVFELDSAGFERRTPRNPVLLANHYLDRRAPIPWADSVRRFRTLAEQLGTPAVATATDMMRALAAVEATGDGLGLTLHAFVFSPAPFEWRVALAEAPNGAPCVPAPRREPVVLSREQLFGRAAR